MLNQAHPGKAGSRYGGCGPLRQAAGSGLGGGRLVTKPGIVQREAELKEKGQRGSSLDSVMTSTNYCSFFKPMSFLSFISMTGIRALVPIRREKMEKKQD